MGEGIEARSRVVRALLFAAFWVSLRIPTDLLVYRCARADVPLVEYAIALQFADVAIAFFMFYRISSWHLRRPWKCPVCDGNGRRFYCPPIGSSETLQTAARCQACGGSGVVWEHGGKL